LSVLGRWYARDGAMHQLKDIFDIIRVPQQELLPYDTSRRRRLRIGGNMENGVW